MKVIVPIGKLADGRVVCRVVKANPPAGAYGLAGYQRMRRTVLGRVRTRTSLKRERKVRYVHERYAAPGRFQEGTLRVVAPRRGVLVTVGCLKGWTLAPGGRGCLRRISGRAVRAPMVTQKIMRRAGRNPLTSGEIRTLSGLARGVLAIGRFWEGRKDYPRAAAAYGAAGGYGDVMKVYGPGEKDDQGYSVVGRRIARHIYDIIGPRLIPMSYPPLRENPVVTRIGRAVLVARPRRPSSVLRLEPYSGEQDLPIQMATAVRVSDVPPSPDLPGFARNPAAPETVRRAGLGELQRIAGAEFQKIARAGVEGTARRVLTQAAQAHRGGVAEARAIVKAIQSRGGIRRPQGVTFEEWRTRIPRGLEHRPRKGAGVAPDELAQEFADRGMIRDAYSDDALDFVSKKYAEARVRLSAPDPKALRREARTVVDRRARTAVRDLVGAARRQAELACPPGVRIAANPLNRRETRTLFKAAVGYARAAAGAPKRHPYRYWWGAHAEDAAAIAALYGEDADPMTAARARRLRSYAQRSFSPRYRGNPLNRKETAAVARVMRYHARAAEEEKDYDPLAAAYQRGNLNALNFLYPLVESDRGGRQLAAIGGRLYARVQRIPIGMGPSAVKEVYGRGWHLRRNPAARIARAFHGDIRHRIKVRIPRLPRTAYEVGKLEAVVYTPPAWSRIGPAPRIHRFAAPKPRLVGFTGRSPWMILGGGARFTARGFVG